MLLFILCTSIMLVLVFILTGLLVVEQHEAQPRDIVAKKNNNIFKHQPRPSITASQVLEASVYDNDGCGNLTKSASIILPTSDNSDDDENSAISSDISDTDDEEEEEDNDNEKKLFQQLVSPSHQKSQEFGASIAMNERLIAVGAPSTDIGTYKQVGMVYIYRQDTHKLFRTVFAPNKVEGLKFGTSVEFVGETDLVISDASNTMYNVPIQTRKKKKKKKQKKKTTSHSNNEEEEEEGFTQVI